MRLVIACLLSFFWCTTALAGVITSPTALNIVIPTGQVSASGSIVSTNTGITSVTLTWADAVHCLQGLSPLTRTIAPGGSTTWTITGVCAQTGTATISGSGTSIVLPVTITVGAALPAGKVIGLTVITESTVQLSWQANSEPDVAGYRLYAGHASKIYGGPVGQVSATVGTVSGLQKGQTYYFAVTAIDRSNNESTFSNEVIYSVP